MTNEEAKLANKVYQRQYATIDGERCPVVFCNEEGALLVDKQDREFFAYWHEIAEGRPDDLFRDTTMQGHPVPRNAR